MKNSKRKSRPAVERLQAFSEAATGSIHAPADGEHAADATSLTYVGGCPNCCRHWGLVHLGKSHLCFCRRHRVKWWVGFNLLPGDVLLSPGESSHLDRPLSDYHEVLPSHSICHAKSHEHKRSRPARQSTDTVSEVRPNYNGYANYETWVVSLWMNNDYANYCAYRQLARDTQRANVSSLTTLGESQASLRNAVADALRDDLEERSPVRNAASVYADLMHAALSEVDWWELASELINDTKDNHE